MQVNLIETATNKVLNDIVRTAIAQALRLKAAAKEEAENQCKKRDEGKPHSFAGVTRLDAGVRALCEVLWQIIGGYPYETHDAISGLEEPPEKR